jgi:hypothetical protein
MSGLNNNLFRKSVVSLIGYKFILNNSIKPRCFVLYLYALETEVTQAEFWLSVCKNELWTDHETGSVWLFLCSKEKPQSFEGLFFILTGIMTLWILELSQQRTGAEGCPLQPFHIQGQVLCWGHSCQLVLRSLWVRQVFYGPDTHKMPFCVFNGFGRDNG